MDRRTGETSRNMRRSPQHGAHGEQSFDGTPDDVWRRHFGILLLLGSLLWRTPLQRCNRSMQHERSQAVPQKRGQQLWHQPEADGGDPQRHGHLGRQTHQVEGEGNDWLTWTVSAVFHASCMIGEHHGDRQMIGIERSLLSLLLLCFLL